MNKTKKILLYSITVFVIVFAIVWEYFMKQWAQAQPDGGAGTVRVDTFVLWPLVLTLVAISLFQIFRKKE